MHGPVEILLALLVSVLLLAPLLAQTVTDVPVALVFLLLCNHKRVERSWDSFTWRTTSGSFARSILTDDSEVQHNV